MSSLRWRLLTIMGAILVSIWLAVTVAAALTTRHQVERLLDAQLARMAEALKVAAEASAAPSREQAGDSVSRYAVPVVYQVESPSGALVRASADAPAAPLGDGPGFGEADVGGTSWRYLSTAAEGGGLIHVASRMSDRDAVAWTAVEAALLPVYLAMPLLLLGLWLGGTACLRPLSTVSSQLASRDLDHLDPLPVADLPREVRPLVSELNSLLGRLDEAFGRFDRFTADAAHELRSPVTAIRSQAEAGLAAASDDDRRHALEQILRKAETCGALVEQVLLLARLEGDSNLFPDDRLELEALAADVMSDLAPRAVAKGLELAFVSAGPVHLRGNEELIRILVRNLLDNALRCTPAGGRVELRVGTDPGGVHLVVEDTGPGIPATDRSQMLQRFCRLPEGVGEGYGIGLSIVERIAEVHQARVLLEDGAGGNGLRVGVQLRSA